MEPQNQYPIQNFNSNTPPIQPMPPLLPYNDPSSKKRVSIWLIGITIIVLLVAVAAYFLLTQNSSKQPMIQPTESGERAVEAAASYKKYTHASGYSFELPATWSTFENKSSVHALPYDGMLTENLYEVLVDQIGKALIIERFSFTKQNFDRFTINAQPYTAEMSPVVQEVKKYPVIKESPDKLFTEVFWIWAGNRSYSVTIAYKSIGDSVLLLDHAKRIIKTLAN